MINPHTPTPIIDVNGKFYLIATKEYSGAYIVKAVNCHAELVEALRELRSETLARNIPKDLVRLVDAVLTKVGVS